VIVYGGNWHGSALPFVILLVALPANAKIAAAIGWAPTRSLDEIVEDVIKFHQAEAVVV